MEQLNEVKKLGEEVRKITMEKHRLSKELGSMREALQSTGAEKDALVEEFGEERKQLLGELAGMREEVRRVTDEQTKQTVRLESVEEELQRAAKDKHDLEEELTGVKEQLRQLPEEAELVRQETAETLARKEVEQEYSEALLLQLSVSVKTGLEREVSSRRLTEMGAMLKTQAMDHEQFQSELAHDMQMHAGLLLLRFVLWTRYNSEVARTVWEWSSAMKISRLQQREHSASQMLLGATEELRLASAKAAGLQEEVDRLANVHVELKEAQVALGEAEELLQFLQLKRVQEEAEAPSPPARTWRQRAFSSST